MAPIKPPTLYIDEKSYFSETPPIAANLPPSWLSSPRGRAPLHYQVDPRKKKVKGPPLPTGRRPLGQPPTGTVGVAAYLAACAVAATSSPWGGTSLSSFITLPHHPYYNLLANMMYGTIYYFSMIYCIYVYV
jgi:hypothetical protein